MAEKSKTVKKVTKIPEATVTIEVEQTVEEAKESEKIETLNETAEVEKEEVKDSEESPKEIEEEKTEKEESDQEADEEKNEESKKSDPFSPVLEPLEESESENNSISWKKIFAYTFIAAFVGILILGGFLFLAKNYDLNFDKKSTTEIATPTSAPTPTVVEIDKEAYEIKVLNGSGIAGEAAKVQATLEAAGFKVSEIGNADSQDFTTSEISALEKVDEEYLAELKKTLGKRGSVKIVEVDSTQTDEVIIIIGSTTDSNTEEIETTPTP